MVLAWENPRRFLWCWSSFCCCSSFVVFLYWHFLFDIIPHPSVNYRQGFRPILYFQPSPSQSDSRRFHFSTIPWSSYRERYGFEWPLFTHRRFLPYASSRHFGPTCFYQGFTGSRQLLSWNLQDFILILNTQTQPICLFDSQ